MRKSIMSLFLALLGTAASFAAPVSPQQAQKVALNYVSVQEGAPYSLSVSSVEMITPELYLINFSPVGYAIISADDTATPIIAYSTECNISKQQIPENMGAMLDEAAMSINIRKSMSNSADGRWTSYTNGAIKMSRAGERVEPLIQVNWNQGSPYNKYCPGTGNNKAVVGCVAVSMSQAMSVQRFPAKPLGRKSYACPGYGTLTINYDNEPEYNWELMFKGGAAGNEEVARLLYHAGVSVSMGYGADGSGIPSNQVYRITDALKEHFGYGSDVNYYWRSQYKGDWEQLLLNELYADRAIVYNAIDSKGGYGHSFNIDGYDGNGLYHVNWGWGGVGNGNFNINSLKDAQMSMNYDASHVAVVGIGGGNSAFHSIHLSDLTIEAGKPAGSYVGVLLINGEPVDDKLYRVNLTGEYNVATGEYITDIPVEYKNGLLVTNREVSLDEGSLYIRIEVSLKSDSNTKLRQGFTLKVEPHMALEDKTSVTYDRDTKMFNIHTKYGATLKLKNAQGAEIPTIKDAILPNFSFSRDNLSEGTNVLEISHEGETKTFNLLK